MLELKNISAGYLKGNNILENLNLSIKEGEVVAIVGQNGSGKSTLAKAIMNMIPRISGNIIFYGNDITRKPTSQMLNSGIGYFMQGGKIFPHLTVKENLRFAGMTLSETEFKNRTKHLNEYFIKSKKVEQIDDEDERDDFDLEDDEFLKKDSSYLSGGEKHKLALSMVLMNKPKLLILDEPSAGLMPGAVKKLYSALTKIKKEEVKSIILIEQRVFEAVDFSNRVVKLENKNIGKEELSKNLNTQEKVEEFFFNIK